MPFWTGNFSAQTIAATTLQVITWTDAQLAGGGGGTDIFAMTNAGTNNGIAGTGTDSHKVKVNNNPVIDCVGAELRALIEAMFPSNLAPATTRLTYQLPFNIPYEFGPCGIPFGSKVTIETQFNAANASAGSQKVSQRLMDVAPRFMPRYVAFQGQVSASGNNQRVNLNLNGELLYGCFLPLVSATGLTRVRAMIAPAPGAVPQELFNLEQGAIIESQTQLNPATITAGFFMRFPRIVPCYVGSYLEVDAGAASGVTDRYVPLSLVPLQVAA